jgi:hypothetical protein
MRRQGTSGTLELKVPAKGHSSSSAATKLSLQRDDGDAMAWEQVTNHADFAVTGASATAPAGATTTLTFHPANHGRRTSPARAAAATASASPSPPAPSPSTSTS